MNIPRNIFRRTQHPPQQSDEKENHKHGDSIDEGFGPVNSLLHNLQLYIAALTNPWDLLLK